MNARLTSITVLLYTFIAVIIFFVVKGSADNSTYAAVYPRVLLAGQALTYKDSTPGMNSYLWEFGNKTDNKSARKKGTYKYTTPGVYIIRLNINNKMVDTFMVYVKKPIVVRRDTAMPTIYAAQKGIVGHRLQFKVLGASVDWCEWSFGESQKVDATDKEAFHTYSSPGTYQVELVTNLNKEPIVHNIKIEPDYVIDAPPEQSTENSGGGAPDLKQSLQKIPGGKNFKKDFDYIVSTFLCNNGHVPVISNGKGGNDFYLYCQLLRSRTNARIDNVASESDPKTNCITKLTITEH
jgi:hypothetical protein